MLKQIQAIVGHDYATDDAARCALATSDVFERNESHPALMVVSPRTTAETAAVVRLLGENDIPAIARGAGLSYTGSFAIDRPVAVIDTSRMTGVDVNAPDRYAVVGAGVSWAGVADALKPFGMAPTQIAPISGAYATVGGLASQGIPAGLDGIIGLAVVLADGSVVQTGAPTHFYRQAGPDVTGLFLGDCGAFGIKTEVVLRIAPELPAAFASFGFDDADAVLESLVACVGERIVTRAFAMDRVKSTDARKVGVGEAVKTAAAVIRRAETLTQSLSDAAKLVRFAASSGEPPWSLHMTMESPTQSGADAQFERACQHLSGEGDAGRRRFSPRDESQALFGSGHGRAVRRALGAGAWNFRAVSRSPGYGRPAGVCGEPHCADAGSGRHRVLAHVRRRSSCGDRADALLA